MSREHVSREVRASGPADGGPHWLDGGRIPCLDGLRALAILLVLASHLGSPADGLPAAHAVRGRCGFLGVQLFFVLSGFLITTLMLREVRRTGRLNLRQFYWRRFLRIAPAYLAFLAALGALQACRQARLDGREWLALATYTVNFLPGSLPWQISHVWSLSVEEHFYLLWPLLMAAWPPARCRTAALVCVAGALGLRWLALLALPDGARFADLSTFTRLDDVAVGCLLAFLSRDPAWRTRLDAAVAGGRRTALLFAGFLAAQVLLSRSVASLLFPDVVAKLLVGVANDVNALTIAVLMWAVLARPAGPVGRLLNHPAAVAVGVVSYSLYLWHPLFGEHAPGVFRQFPFNLAGTATAAGLSYVLIERPFLSLKSRATSAAAPAPAAPASPRLARAAEAAPSGGRRPVRVEVEAEALAVAAAHRRGAA